MIPGEYLIDGPDLEINAGRPTVKSDNNRPRPAKLGKRLCESDYYFRIQRGANDSSYT